MSIPPSPARRALLRGGAALALAAWAPWLHAAPRRDITVLTAYPDAVVSRVEAAFERAFPHYRLRMVWRMPHDAGPYLLEPGQHGVDVYWSASPNTYARLKAAGALQALNVDFTGLPARLGGSPLRDADGYYTASETAGYGFVLNPKRLAELNLAAPSDWPELAAPAYAGQLLLPNPMEVGFAPVLVDIPLQSYGWDTGWALWSAIAANGDFIGRGGGFVSEEIASGRKAIGLSIDFFVVAAIANGAPLRFVYPRQGGINPGHIAITASSPNPAGARDFVRFVLSADGQALLTHPDIRKLPVRPASYARLPAGHANPFAVADSGGYRYDNGVGQARTALVAAAFGQACVRPHARLAALWRALRAGDPAQWSKVWPLLVSAPLTEAEASQPALQQLFANRRDNADSEQQARAHEARWAKQVDARLDQAARLLGVSA